MRLKRLTCLVLIAFAVIIVASGCTRRVRRGSGKNKVSDNAVTTEVASSDAQGSAVIADIDYINEELALKDIDSEWTYHVKYDVDTDFQTRFGEVMSPEQIKIGEIADVCYDRALYRLKSLRISIDAWQYEDVKGLTYNQSNNTITVKGETFPYDNGLVLRDDTIGQMTLEEVNGLVREDEASKDASDEADEDEDKEKEKAVVNNMALSEIDPCDTVTCWGYKGRICSVILTSGHGYVRLSSYSSFVGGMVAIGDVVSPVTEDLVMAVPVGDWTLEIDKDGRMGTKDVSVHQNEDQTVNLASLIIIASKKGLLHFITDPEGCTITIDGKDYEGRSNFSLDYGLHRVVVAQVGYKAYNGTIYVNTAYANVNVTLNKLDDDEESEASTDYLKITTAKKSTTTSAPATTTEDANTLTTEAAE